MRLPLASGRGRTTRESDVEAKQKHCGGTNDADENLYHSGATPPHDDGDGDFDGDYAVKSGDAWDYARDLSPHDIDKDGEVELPRYIEVPVSSSDEYTMAEVVRHVVTHEMGHAVGIAGDYETHCDDPSCLMYRISNNWKRDGHFCNDCRSRMYIHND
ncbi:MAG: hypothetical protein JSU94_16700 [Phycisphaerales bacterium]|nr:MAG: hypothetical protein JSU94_16700 [Phycisphaerales bacterium]